MLLGRSKTINLYVGRKHVSMQLPKSLSGLTNLLFNRRNLDQVSTRERKPLRPGKVSPPRPVPSHMKRPPYVKTGSPPGIASGPEVHDERGIECMRASGRLAAQVLEYAGTLVKPGVKTDEIDEAVHQMIIDNGGYPSPLGYGGFPKSVCTSVNECICHGIPDSRPLEDGDIINIDVTAYLNGYHGDTSASFFCGEVDDEAKKLVQVTKECLDHENLYWSRWNDPMAYPVFLNYNPIMWDDNWTVVTEDGSLSAQFEHTILITKDGAEILTQC
ncbi:methionine aminopeptidase 1D, chloroplastic/mitochondrial-like [Chenopodium quinoa]|uniref:methionine aminopeptidase 1D, chloroplastic/mitochondrial-like n=1 Tax=Chenopodium quinoa TaxID=63459 RepID=UPI000B772AD2|nr:methionine aminopeptidase 1D, chloroplastic/mitochondrial-like [Chenopodium quinoa]